MAGKMRVNAATPEPRHSLLHFDRGLSILKTDTGSVYSRVDQGKISDAPCILLGSRIESRLTLSPKWRNATCRGEACGIARAKLQSIINCVPPRSLCGQESREDRRQLQTEMLWFKQAPQRVACRAKASGKSAISLLRPIRETNPGLGSRPFPKLNRIDYAININGARRRCCNIETIFDTVTLLHISSESFLLHAQMTVVRSSFASPFSALSPHDKRPSFSSQRLTR